MPTVFLPHGGGPWPFIDGSMFGPRSMWANLRAYLEGLAQGLMTPPQALLIISAHWEASVPTVMTSAQPPMLYDYYGFDKAAYEVKWPAPGAPELAGDVRRLLNRAGIASAADGERGFDHGTFVPMKLVYPEANVPTLQLSLKTGLDPAAHIEIGRALAPLRSQGVFIVGSGMSYHNLAVFREHMSGRPTSVDADSRGFDDWLVQAMLGPSEQRIDRLIRWEQAPAARASHPREEHLLPLMVVAGAADGDPAQVPYRDQVMGAHVSAIHFG